MIFVLLALLQLKHLVFDFVLQTPFQVMNKGKYGHPGGIIHAGLHAVGTFLVLLVARPSPLLGFAIIAVEFLVHYHIDWLKEQVLKRFDWTPAKQGYWVALGVDQFCHHLTYVAIVAVLHPVW